LDGSPELAKWVNVILYAHKFDGKANVLTLVPILIDSLAPPFRHADGIPSHLIVPIRCFFKLVIDGQWESQITIKSDHTLPL